MTDKAKIRFLVDAQARHREHPDTFELPLDEELDMLGKSYHAKVIVNDRERIELKKYCRWDRKHTVHKETR